MLGLTHVQVGALRQCVLAVGDVEHIIDHSLVIAVAVIQHAHGVGSGAVWFTLGVLEIALQIDAGLGVIALVVIALADQSVQLSVKVVVLPHFKQ